jgi:SAM-dependent methyltransferase
LSSYDFKIKGAQVGELGPGDSIGIGLAAILSGAGKYIGLDIVPFSAKSDLSAIFDELIELYVNKESVPDDKEFPKVRPKLSTYDFPDDLIDWEDFFDKAERIRAKLSDSLCDELVSYQAPWTSPDDIVPGSLDLVFSQAVLEHVDDLKETYRTMSMWLKPGGYASHVIDFSAHHLAPFWNGHWAYSDTEWRLVRGRREFLLNREPLGTHLTCVEDAGFNVVLLRRDYADGGIKAENLSHRFQVLDKEDARTRGAILILRKKQ